VADESGRTLTFAYQGARISSITDPLNRTVAYGYSAAGDLTSVTDARAKVWSHTYDTGHRMLTKKDPNNNAVLTNVYTSLDRVYTQTDAKGGVTRFDYENDGGRTDAVDPRGGVTRYYFDTSYRVTQTYDPYNKIVNRFYDTRDNLLRIEDKRRSSPINNTYFTYDARGNVLPARTG
jgi:YD repeat-containing protein